ncbi:hypothetical protein [Mesobacterium hydrothermale]|uniref:hypothetical protein n=1 Tax=Mesobacterium hydrothermale TaxID=3111907 RepID=UPI002DBCB29E|nr:hypothetical protein [Mesobacterium sp. TK19101]
MSALPVPARAAEFRLEWSSGSTWHHLPLMQGALDQFLGPGRGSGGSGGGLHDSLSSGLGVRVVPGAASELGLGLRWRGALPGAGGLDWRLGLRAATGHARYRLPEGIGVLRDPMQVRISHWMLTPEAGVVADLGPLGPLRLEAGLSAGVDLLGTQGRFTSALIALERVDRWSDPFAAVELGLRGGSGAARDPLGTLRLRRSARFGTQVTLGLSLALGRR